VDPRAGLDAVMKKKFLPHRESNPGRPAHSLVTVLTELWRSPVNTIVAYFIVVYPCVGWCVGEWLSE